MKRMTQWLILVFVTLTCLGVGASTPVTTLRENRFLDFNDYAATNGTPPVWVHVGDLIAINNAKLKALLQGTNHFHWTGWSLINCRAGCDYLDGRVVPPMSPSSAPAYPPLTIASNLAANLRNDLGAYVESPVFTNGIGTVYFEAINGNSSYPVEVTVDVATNTVVGTNGLEYAWQPANVLSINAATTNDFVRYSQRFLYRQWMKIRFRRTGTIYSGSLDSYFTVLDNIRVSCPPADVSVSNVRAVHQSGNVTLNAYISNVDTNALATNRVVTGYYRWVDLTPPANAWTNAPMPLVDAGDGLGNGEKYAATVPVQTLASRLEYYVVCAFDGDWYSSPDYVGQNYTNYASECLSPRTTLSQTNQYYGANSYSLAVARGIGSGVYTNGQPVSVAASNLTGQAFNCWSGDTQYVASATSPSTTVTMPARDVSLVATYTNAYFTLSVNSGSGSGSYTNGQQVAVVANAPAANKVFYRWTGDTAYVSSVTSSTAVVTMPASNVTVTATYLDAYVLTVNSGSGSGAYTNGQQVVISANAPSAGMSFYRWVGDAAYVSSVTSATTTVTMPASAVNLTATYIVVYTLTVNSGAGSGSYTNGQQVAISANPPGTGRIFYQWTGDTQYLANAASSTTAVSMPASNITVTATYLNVYTLTVGNGSGSGTYLSGTLVPIVANSPAAGMAFNRWTGDVFNVANVYSPATTLAMPAANAAIAATYSNLFYKLTVVNGSGGGTYTNGEKVSISADLSGGKVFLQWGGSVANVANVSATTTTVTMPNSDITVIAMLSSATNSLVESRYLDFNDYALTNWNNGMPPTWVHVGDLIPIANNQLKALLQGTNHFHRTGWSLINCRAGCDYYDGGRVVPPLSPSSVPTYPTIASNLAANLRNDLGAYIESPVFTNGVGTIYFDAINGKSGNAVELSVDVATNAVVATNGVITYVWQTIDVLPINVSTINDFVRYSRLINCRQWMKIRIRRSGALNGIPLDANFTVVDNIRVSMPPSDVTISKTDCPFEPGYPGVNTNITLRCYVSDVDTNVPTDSRWVRAVYRWRYLNQQIGAWRTNDMVYVSGTGNGDANSGIGCRYETSIAPFAEIGDLEYYFICAFGGPVFQSPDCTGTGLVGTPMGNPGVYPYQTENLSPRYLRSSASREFYFRLRPYQSMYSALYAVTDQNASPIPMLLSGDNEWRAMVPVGATGITNLTWRFMGVGKYEAGAETASTGSVYWTGLSDVSGGNVPYGGVCVTNGGDSSRLTVGINSGAYAMLTLNTATFQYMANRAEYQNFNYWPAPLETFSDSNGQMEKQYFLNTFDVWPTNADDTYSEAFILPVISHTSYSPDAFNTQWNWLAGRAKYVTERAFDTNPLAATNANARNVAIRMKGGDGDLGLGYIQNTDNNMPDGLKQITFNARAGQTSDNYDVVYRRDGFSLANYLVRATIRATDLVTLSPENPSLSVVAYYQDPGDFYEFRITQVTNTTGTAANPQDVRVLYQLLKWVNGTPSELTSAYAALTVTPGNAPLTLPNDGAPVEMRLYTSGASTLIRCKFNAWDNVLVYTDSSSAFTSGTYGFMSAECKAQIANVITQSTTVNAVGTGTTTTTLATTTGTSSGFNFDLPYWYYPTNRYVANNSVSPNGIYSILPRQALGLYVQQTNSTSWTLMSQVYVTNFAYQPYTVTFNSWQSEYVKLQVMGGDSDVIADELCVYSWHGKTVPSGYTTTGWRGTEAWVVSNSVAGGNYVQLDHSRANPSLAQSVRSLLLTNGMGVLEYDYRVDRAPAKITVQYAEQYTPSLWQNVSSVVVSNTTGWIHASTYLGSSTPGYLRVLNERSDGYTNAWVDIDNVTAWDEPFVTNTSWKVYNAKITQTDTNRVYLDETKACFLNNSVTNEVAPRPMDVFQPFLQSPTLPKGLGTLSFLARAYTNNETATLYLYASTNGWGAPTNQWFWLDNYSFTITNTLYHLYTYAPAGGLKNINAIRLMTRNSVGAKRVCLEEVAIAEPVLPGFDIVNVRLLNWDNNVYTNNPQPLAGDDVDVEARVANQQLAPSNIAMYVSYYVGTNVWGIGNWPTVVTRRMHAVAGDPTLYRTRHDDGGVSGLDASLIGPIKNQDADAVVQYYVWADYDGGAPSRLKVQQSSFENPSWYYPVDLNVRYAARGWSPYYLVYNIRRNAVWINEINATDYVTDGSGNKMSGVWDNRYIEIAVPAWLDLAGWSVDLVTSSGYSTQTITIPSGFGTHTADTNGYYFFVIGDAYNSTLPRMDFGYPNLANKIPYVLPGGLRLKRPLGMYEQTIAYDWNAAYGDSFNGALWATNDPQKRFVYVGRESNGGSLSKTGICSPDTPDNTSTWYFPKTWTPGAPNEGQTILISGDTLQPGVSNIWITSLFTLLKGTQNDKRIQTYIIKTRVGAATNINYQIDDWYRLYSLQANTAEVLSSAEQSSGVRSYSLAIPNPTNDISITAQVLLRKDLADYQDNPSMLAWIMGFADGDLVPSYNSNGGGWVELSMTDKYWLDLNPTITNYFSFPQAGPVVDSATTNVFLTIRMSVSNELGGSQALLGSAFQGGAVLKLRAKQNLSDPEWTLVRQYSLEASSFDTNNVCHVYVPDPFAVLIAGMTPSSCFFNWVIEMNDPRVEIESLINSTLSGPWPALP